MTETETPLDYKAVMKMTGLKHAHVYQLFKAGELPGFKAGTRAGIRFDPQGVRDFMERRRNKPPAPLTPPPPVALPEVGRRRKGRRPAVPYPVFSDL
jgi:predicted DNA-binding transcriptional regulator AlpA